MRARSRLLAPFVFLAALATAPVVVHADPAAASPAQYTVSLGPDAQSLASEAATLNRDLATFAAGFETSLESDDVSTAESIYELEVRATRLLVKTSNVSYDTPEARVDALADARSTVARIFRFQERLQVVAIAKLDKALPGEPGRKGWARRGIDLVRPLFRLGTPQPGVPAPTPEQAYDQMKADFVAKGGKPSDFHILGPRTVDEMPTDKLVEWTQFGKDSVRFTSAGAKHPVIGMGRSVRGAGSMRVFRDASGGILLVIVSNSSGNYKPGTGATEGVVQRLVDIGVPAHKIIVTSVIPGEPELVKLIMKARTTFTKEQIADRAAALVARAKGAPTYAATAIATPTAAPVPTATVVAKAPRAPGFRPYVRPAAYSGTARPAVRVRMAASRPKAPPSAPSAQR